VSPLRVQPTRNGVRVTIRVQPRSTVTEITGVHGDALRVRLTAPPVDGAANDSLVALLADTFEIPRALVTIVSGASSRTKIVELRGITEERVRRIVDQ
jgi:uncharacterized protein